MADMHKKVAKYMKRFDNKKIAEDEIDGKKGVCVCEMRKSNTESVYNEKMQILR